MKLQSAKVITINVIVTFVEGFGAAWLLTGNQLDKASLVGAGASGISLAWNTVVKPLLKSKKLLYSK